MGWIERLRKKPQEVRTQYAFFTAFTVTALIAFVWVTSLPAKFNNELQNNELQTEESGGIVNSFKGFGTLFNGAKDSFSNVIVGVRGNSTSSSESSNGNTLNSELNNEEVIDSNTIDIEALLNPNNKAEPPKTKSTGREILIATSTTDTINKP